MIPFSIVKCVNPYIPTRNWQPSRFEIGTLYISYPSRDGKKRVFDSNGVSVAIEEPAAFITYTGDFFSSFFETIATTHLKNFKECKEMQGKTIAEILDILP